MADGGLPKLIVVLEGLDDILDDNLARTYHIKQRARVMRRQAQSQSPLQFPMSTILGSQPHPLITMLLRKSHQIIGDYNGRVRLVEITALINEGLSIPQIAKLMCETEREIERFI